MLYADRFRLMDTTIFKGLAVLERLAESDQPRGVTELSQQMNLTKSNVQRVLSTLVELGYAQKDTVSGRYKATLRMWEFGYKTLSRDRVRLAAASQLRRLCDLCNETVFLCMGDGLDIVYVDKMEGTDPNRVFCTIGMRLPALSTAAGRAISAFQDEAVIEHAIGELRRVDPMLMDDDAAIEMQEKLMQIRVDGYAASFGEFRTGTNSLAAPVWNGDSKPIASVVINGSNERLPSERLTSLASDAVATAARISETLGYRISRSSGET
ncbi:transcriptional regulator, IclR family [Burkholderia sp. GAS332]|nr:transcriptional regulator, IclR family [Burkholderia sp. GAS332]